jgi:hypothetical protein
MKNPVKMFRSVASITAGLNRMVSDLTALADAKEAEADSLQAKIDVLSAKRYAAIDERTKAIRVSAKINDLVSA